VQSSVATQVILCAAPCFGVKGNHNEDTRHEGRTPVFPRVRVPLVSTPVLPGVNLPRAHLAIPPRDAGHGVQHPVE
jgi:hypothetical protein